MKKVFIAVFLSLLVFIPCLYGCKDSPDYSKYVTELRSDIYYGEKDDIKLKASYGFIREKEKVNILTFKLIGKETDAVSYSVEFSYGDLYFNKNFTFNPVSNSLVAVVEVDNFTPKTFTAYILYGTKREEIELSSVVPEGTIDYNSALNALFSSQKELMNSFYRDGEFCGKITERIVVKKERAYYYVNVKGENKNKALLIDGKTAALLAVREIIG